MIEPLFHGGFASTAGDSNHGDAEAAAVIGGGAAALALAGGILASLCIKIAVTAGIYLGALWLLKAAILRESLEYLLHKKK